MGLTPEAYARQLKQLLPRGSAWPLDPDSGLSKLLLGIAQELARIDARAVDLEEELDPRTTTECIGDWERVLGLPDLAFPSGATVEARRSAAHVKYTARGGATSAYFLEVATRMGFAATYDEPALHTWRLTVDLGASTSPFAFSETWARAGTARAGDRIRRFGVLELEGTMIRLRPAHTVLWIRYEE